MTTPFRQKIIEYLQLHGLSGNAQVFCVLAANQMGYQEKLSIIAGAAITIS